MTNEEEVEAVARALYEGDIAGSEWDPWSDFPPALRAHWYELAKAAIAALNALRSSGSAAQNQEGRCEECGHLWSRHRGSTCLDCDAARSPQDEDPHPDYDVSAILAERSPQDEDHEVERLRAEVERLRKYARPMHAETLRLRAEVERLRSGSAAQNQEEEWQYTEEKMTPGQADAAAHMARGCGAARSPQDEDHEA
jgi:hypothetical protein